MSGNPLQLHLSSSEIAFLRNLTSFIADDTTNFSSCGQSLEVVHNITVCLYENDWETSADDDNRMAAMGKALLTYIMVGLAILLALVCYCCIMCHWRARARRREAIRYAS